MRPIATLASAVLLITSAATGLQQRPPDTPNVVLIMTDDAGYADIGSYRAPDIRTPNIDSLARDGAKLTDFYANAMSCTPTRAGRSYLRRRSSAPYEIGPDYSSSFRTPRRRAPAARSRFSDAHH
jgi:hypothetical protein